jgi:hypothetical protein
MEAAGQPLPGPLGRRLPANTPLILFGLALLASGGLLLYWLHHITFFYDDWDPLLLRRRFSTDAILRPHVDHIIISVTLIYKAIQATIGMESLTPYALTSVGMFLASVVLFFAYVRRRVGDWLALAAAVPILFLGAAHDDLLWPYEISFTGAMVFGLGALLVLERRPRYGDALVCLLLVISFTFGELALPFVFGVALVIALDRGPWRRAYVVIVPLLFYAAWYAGWGHEATRQTNVDLIATSPAYMLDGLASSVGAILGFSGSPFTDTTALEWGRPLLLLVIVATVLRLRSGAPVSRWFWVTLVILVSFWLLTASNAGIFRPPTSSRYQYAGAMLLLLFAADLATGIRLKWPGIAIALAIAGIAALGSISTLHQWYGYLADLTVKVRGGLAGLEIAHDRVSPGFTLNQENSDVNYLDAVEAGPYLSATDKYGSPAYSESELPGAPEEARVAADKVLGSGLGLAYRSLPRPPSGLTGCRPAGNAPGRPGVVTLPPGGAILEAQPGSSASLLLRRYASAFSVNGGRLQGVARLDVPTDRSNRPWQLQIDGAHPVTVCELPLG